jgi:hypothetical protein
VVGGDESGPEWQLFSMIWDMLVGPDGKMYLSDAKRVEVFILNADGTLHARVGRKGSGPGEFQVLSELHWSRYGEEFWAEDGRLRRMTRFGTDGQLLGTLSYAEAGTRWDRFECLTSDRVVGISLAQPVGLYSMTVLSLLDGQLRFITDITTIRTRQHYTLGSGVSINIPFTYPARVWPFPDGRFVIANPEEATLLICDSEGSPQVTIGKHWDFPAVSKREIEAWKRLMHVRYSTSDLNKVPIPKYKPPFNNYRTDDLGLLWVQCTHEAADEEPSGDVSVVVDFFGPTGEWLGEQDVPFLPLIIQGGYAYNLPSSEEVTPRVERYRITPRVSFEKGGD